jgi:hypothetical protein
MEETLVGDILRNPLDQRKKNLDELLYYRLSYFSTQLRYAPPKAKAC